MKISFDALRDRNCALLFFGQLISQSCDKMMSIGLVWMFADRYPQAVIAWFLGVSALPHLLLSWHAGRWTTRLGRLRTLIVTDLFRGAVFILLAAVWPRLPVEGAIVVLFAASFVANSASALFNPAMFSMPSALASPAERNAPGERLQQLTAMVDSCLAIGNIVGPALSAVLYPWLGLRGLFLFNGLSYLFAAWLATGIRIRKSAPAEGEDAGGELSVDGLSRILAKDRLIRLMLLGFLASNLFLAPLMVFLPLFVKASYHGSIGTLAVLETIFGAGTVVGGIFLSAVKLDARMGLKIAASMVAVALAYFAFTLTRTPLSGALCLSVLGFFLAMTNVFSMTLFQTRIASRNVPVFMSAVNLISVASLPVSMTGVGFLIGVVDVRALALAFGLALLAVTALVVSNRELRTTS